MKKITIDRKQVIYFLKLGVPKTRIAKKMNISKHTLHRYLKNNPITDKELSEELSEEETLAITDNKNIDTQPKPTKSEKNDIHNEETQDFLESLMSKLEAPKD